MKRPLSLLLIACIAGCSAANGATPRLFSSASGHRLKAESLKADPTPSPSPAPLPVPPPAPLPVPEPDPVPTLTLPAEVEGNVGEFIKVAATTNASHVRWVPLEKGLAVFPGEMLRDSTSTVVMSATAGQYKLLAYAALGGVPTDPVTTMVVVNGPQPPPAPAPIPGPAPDPTPAPTPAPVPPPAPNLTAAKLWIVTIDDASKRSATTAAVLSDMTTWNGFTAQGHQWRKLNISEPQAAKFKQMVDANGGIPAIVIMDSVKALAGQPHSWLNQNPDDLKLPATAAGLKALVAKYTAR